MKEFIINYTKTEFELMKSYEPIPPLRGNKQNKMGLPLHTRIMGKIEELQMNNDFLNYKIKIILKEK